MRGFIAALITLNCVLCIPAFAADEQVYPVNRYFSILWENDLFNRTDENYTNGISIAMLRTDAGILGGVWDLGGKADGTKTCAYELSQLQFTPSDLDRSTPDYTDRPYTGLTYLASTTHLQQGERLQSLKLMLGIVGPASGAEDLQKATHKLLGQKQPKGWRNQLRNEAVVNLLYESRYRYRFSPVNGIGIDLIPMGGAFLGNYLIQAQSELLLRIGYRLPDDFGPTSLRGIGYLPYPRPDIASQLWGVNAYVRGGAHLVARNLSLDGNTFVNSQSVEKRTFVPVVEGGSVLWTHWFMVTASYQVWGREFDSQKVREGYGSILFSFPF